MKSLLYTIVLFFFVTLNLSAEEQIDISNELTDANIEYLENVYQFALKEFDQQNYDKSLMYIRHVIKSDMNNYKLRYLAAHDHWKLGSFDSATIHFQTAIYTHPELPQTYMDLALMKLQQRDYYTAQRTLDIGYYYLQKNNTPVPSKYYNIYSRLELMKGLPAQSLRFAQLAKAAFDQSGTGSKDKLEAMTLEARSQLLLENFDKAELALQWAISMRKNNTYAHNLLGFVYTKWRQKILTADPVQAENLKKLALENFNAALKSPGLVDEFKTIIETNIANVK